MLPNSFLMKPIIIWTSDVAPTELIDKLLTLCACTLQVNSTYSLEQNLLTFTSRCSRRPCTIRSTGTCRCPSQYVTSVTGVGDYMVIDSSRRYVNLSIDRISRWPTINNYKTYNQKQMEVKGEDDIV